MTKPKPIENHSADASKMVGCAAGPWRTDEPPKDGTWILGDWGTILRLAQWNGTPSMADPMRGWIDDQTILVTDPIRWAELNTESEEER